MKFLRKLIIARECIIPGVLSSRTAATQGSACSYPIKYCPLSPRLAPRSLNEGLCDNIGVISTTTTTEETPGHFNVPIFAYSFSISGISLFIYIFRDEQNLIITFSGFLRKACKSQIIEPGFDFLLHREHSRNESTCVISRSWISWDW